MVLIGREDLANERALHDTVGRAKNADKLDEATRKNWKDIGVVKFRYGLGRWCFT